MYISDYLSLYVCLMAGKWHNKEEKLFVSSVIVVSVCDDSEGELKNQLKPHFSNTHIKLI